MLWKDGLAKEARDKLIEDFEKVITINTEDREDIEVRLAESKEALNGLVDSLKQKGLEVSSRYIENLSRGIFTYVGVLLEKGEVISRTTGPIERSIREIGRRIRRLEGVGRIRVLQIL